MRTIPAEQFATWSRRLRASDERAFEALYRSTYDALHRYVWLYLRDADLCGDVLQELYFKLWLIREQLDPERSLKALLYQMARNFALNHVRSRSRNGHLDFEQLFEEPASAASAEEVFDGNALARVLSRCIDELPPRQREAFCLSRYAGLNHEEIAAVMHLAPKTVNNHIVLALQTLRQRLHRHDADLPLRS